MGLMPDGWHSRHIIIHHHVAITFVRHICMQFFSSKVGLLCGGERQCKNVQKKTRQRQGVANLRPGDAF